MKKINIIYILLFFTTLCSAQEKPSINKLDAGLSGNKKIIIDRFSGNEVSRIADTSYTLVIVLRLNEISENNTIELYLGNEKNSGNVFRKSMVLKSDDSDRKKLYAFEGGVTIGEIKRGFLQIFYPISLQETKAVKWLSASIKKDNYESEKAYYEFK